MGDGVWSMCQQMGWIVFFLFLKANFFGKIFSCSKNQHKIRNRASQAFRGQYENMERNILLEIHPKIQK